MEVNNEDMNDTAALRSLALGVDFDDEEVSLDGEESVATSDETDEFLQAAAQGRPAETQKVETVVSESREELANVEIKVQREQGKLQAMAVAKVQAARRALHFRKVALPFLIAMAVVLFVVAFATTHLASNSTPEAIEDNPLLANSGIFAGICIAMAVVMLAGAGFFVFEMKKLKAFIDKAQ